MEEKLTRYEKYKKTYQKYTENHKELYRAIKRNWKLKQIENGKCSMCGQAPIVAYSKCLKHAIQHREYERHRMGRIERYCSKTYDYEDSMKGRLVNV